MKLSVKFSVVNAIVAALVVGAAVWATYVLITNNVTGQVNTRQSSAVQQARDRIDRYLVGRQVALHNFGRSPQLSTYVAKPTPASSQAIYQNLQALNAAGYWTNIGILNLDSQTLHTLTDQQNKPSNNILNDNQALKALYDSAKKGETPHSDAFVINQTKTRTIAFAAPIRNGEKIIGVVIGEASWQPIENTLKDIVGSSVHIINQNGQIIASNKQSVIDQEATVQGNELKDKISADKTGTVKVSKGISSDAEHLVAYSYEDNPSGYTGNKWHYVAEVTTSEALASARRLTLQLAIAFVIMTSLAVVFVIAWISKTLIRPIRTLSGAVSRIALGDLSQTLPVKSSDEIGILSRNFNEMTRQLAATHRSLQDTSLIAKEKHAQLESSINGLRQGFILTDKNNNIVMANDAALNVLREAHGNEKFSVRDMVKVDQFVGVLPTDIDLLTQIKHTMSTHKLTKFPVLPVGGHFLNLYLSPVVNDGESIGCVLLLEDVTEERILQRSRDEFFSIASHELRTPLTAIRGNAMLMKQYYPEVFNNPDLGEMIGDIHDSSVRLIEIVNDFLDVSRLEQNKMKFELSAFSLEPIAEKIIYELAGLSRDKKIKLIFEHHTLGKLPMVYGDESRIKQILYNLIGNGMKFTDKGSVTISAQPEGKVLKVFVTDTGPGISEEAQQLLFHKFQQAGQSILTRDNTRGTGLGLYISKLLLEHMGGTVRLEHSEVGKGSTFSFTMPLATESQIKQQKTDDASAQPKKVINKSAGVHARIIAAPNTDKD
jgi:signal transduction histidine kinase